MMPTLEVEVAEPLTLRPERVVVPKPVLETERKVVPTLKAPEIKPVVLVAFVLVEFEKIAVLGVAAPIGVFSIVPPEIVRLSATRESASEPMVSARSIPSVEVATSA